MNVLITQQFNNSMLRLSPEAQREVVQLYGWVIGIGRQELIDSPLLTRLVESSEEMYSLRTRLVRVFCTIDEQDNVIFLDVQGVKHNVPKPHATSGQVTLYGPRGDPKAYIDYSDDRAIYSFDGRPLAYVDQASNVYGFNGKHLGWFEDGIVWDHQGRRVGFTSATCPAFTQFEPFKGFKKFKPFAAFKQFAPFKPYKGRVASPHELLAFLESGAR